MLRLPMTLSSSRLVLPFLLIAGLFLSGCGDDETPQRAVAPQPATLILDFTPNAVHAGTYLATARGYDRDEGVRLAVRVPSGGADAIKLLRSGRADFAYMDIHDLALADAKAPGELTAVMALVQQPLAAVLAAPGVSRPRDLEGKRAGVSGLPSDVAVLRSIVAGDGGDPDRVKLVTIGFQAVAAVMAGRVAAATGFWNVEGLALREKRPATREFRVDGFGAPAYPELVLVTRPQTLKSRPQLVRATIAALRLGYEAAIDDMDSAVEALTGGAGGVDAETARKELEAVAPAFTAAGGRFGELDPPRLREWAAWEQRFGIVKRKPDTARLFAAEFAR